MPGDTLVGMDALALVRFGLRAADDPRILDTIKVIDHCIDTPLFAGAVFLWLLNAQASIRWRCASSFARSLDTIFGAAEVFAQARRHHAVRALAARGRRAALLAQYGLATPDGDDTDR